VKYCIKVFSNLKKDGTEDVSIDRSCFKLLMLRILTNVLRPHPVRSLKLRSMNSFK
jgi:hypothetical protein